VYVKFLEKRCREIIETNLEDTQCGFRPGCTTTDQIFTPPQSFCEILVVCQRRLHMFCRPRESIRPGSSGKGLGNAARVMCYSCLLLAVKSLYSCSNVYVRVVVFREGCVLSPFHLIVYIRDSQPGVNLPSWGKFNLSWG